MKLAISNIAWEQKDDDRIYNLMHKYGFLGLEIAPTRFFENNPYDTKLDILNKLKNSIKFEICSMQSILFNKPELVLFENEIKRKNMLEYLKQAVVFAKNLGISNIVFGNPKNRISNSKDDFEIAISFFNELGNFAFENNVKIGIEANPLIYGGNFITHTKEAIEFINKIQNNGIGLNLDIGTMIENNEKIDILNNISIDKISHVHISEPYLNLIEKRNLHLDLFGFLRDKKYSNFISIEMKKQDISLIENTLDYVRSL